MSYAFCVFNHTLYVKGFKFYVIIILFCIRLNLQPSTFNVQPLTFYLLVLCNFKNEMNITKKLTQRKKILLFFLMIALIFIPIILLKLDTTKKYIKSNSIAYSNKIGWVNWNHAIKKDTKNAFERFTMLNNATSDSIVFEYAQQTKSYLTKEIVFISEYKERRKFKTGMDQEQLQKAFSEIFISVSNGFEKNQAQLPNISFYSSFRKGDLMGNLVSLYLTYHDITLESFKKTSHCIDPMKALDKFEQLEHKKEYLDDIQLPSDSDKVFRSFLEEHKRIGKECCLFSKLISTHKEVCVQF